MQVLIAPKPFKAYEPEEYHTYIQSMYGLRTRGSAKPKSPVEGVTLTRTKKGALSIRRTKVRAFAYITTKEIAALAKSTGITQAEIWNLFKEKNYMITADRMEAERRYSEITGLPW